MSEQMNGAVKGFIGVFANLDYSGAPLYCGLIVVSILICLEGIKFYKLIIKAMAFLFGYRLARQLLWARIPNDELLLMAEVAVGLFMVVLSWKIYQAGIGIMVFQFALDNVVNLFEGKLGYIVCFAIAVGIALISVKLNRPVIVILTAVIGGFAAVNFFVKMIPVFPVDLGGFPGPSSPVWLFAKVFLSMAGVGVQDVRERGDSF